MSSVPSVDDDSSCDIKGAAVEGLWEGPCYFTWDYRDGGIAIRTMYGRLAKLWPFLGP